MSYVQSAVRFGILLGACTALAGCLSSGGGGAGGGGGGGGGTPTTPADYDAAFNRISALGPTQDMPITGTATYNGAAKVALNKGTDKIGDLLGDLEFTVDFAAANADSTKGLSGKAGNFRGTVDGTDVAFEGELTTAAASARGLPQTVGITTTTITLPIVGGERTLRTGSFMAHLAGDLDVAGESGLVVVQTGGTFFGDGGQAITGPVGGTWWGPGGPSEYTVGGTWYVEK